VDDAPAADVYAVMAVQRARSDKMGAERWLVAGTKEDVACIVGTPIHGSDVSRGERRVRLHDGFDDT
jgi:hypothetical protein